MGTNPGNQRDQLVEKIKAIGAILGVPLALFAIVSNIVTQPIIALVVALVTLITLSVWAVYTHRIGITGVIIAWLTLFVIALAAFVIWPKTMTVEGVILDSTGNPVSNEQVVLFDYSGRRYETTTNSEGSYQFKDVPTGEYRVQVRDTKVAGQTTGILVRVEKQNITVPIRTPTPDLSSLPTPTIGLPTVQRACSEPPNSEPNIRIRRVAAACGCQASDFSIIKIDSRSIQVTGEWNNPQTKTILWAFLTEENNDEVLVETPRRVRPDTPGQSDWNIFLVIPREADGPGKSFHVWLLVLNQEASDAFQKDIDDGAPITLPNPPEDQPHQEILIERVEVIENRASSCPEGS
ncbi:MAG: carboxypeptidase regulatory-like domain-containing protein [Chloroflexi bacterium]|nr:carboxypeptidase regulatory-like domain-containing protein [Chloroflexota bacterium]